MPIVDFADVLGAYKSLENGGFTAERVDTYHIPYAQAELESLLGVKNTVPFSNNNVVAKDLVVKLTYSRIAPVSKDDRDELRKEVLDAVERLLSGEAVMITDSGDILPGSAAAGIWSSTEDYHPIFTVDNPENWVVDEDQIDDIRSERDQS